MTKEEQREYNRLYRGKHKGVKTPKVPKTVEEIKAITKVRNAKYRARHEDQLKVKRSQYYNSHKDAIIKKSSQWYNDNKEQSHQHKAKWRNSNKDYIKETTKIYEYNNKDAIKKYKQQHYRDNRETVLKRCANYRERNPHKIALLAADRRFKLEQATPYWAELDDINTVYLKRDEYRKIYKLKFEVDHIIPINSDTVCGLHVLANLQILDKSLNSRKTNNYQTDW